MKIKTNFWMKPIPMRQFDWEAWRENDEPDDEGHMKIGYGKTEKEAIDDLMVILEE